MLAARGRFGAALQAMRAALGVAEAPLPAILSGMVGSAQRLDRGAVPRSRRAADAAARAPGARCPARRRWRSCRATASAAAAAVDVMRGEETQLLGALAARLGHGDGWCVLPGTHSKWVRLQGGAIAEFATFMTGELFALLSQHGTLAAASAADAPAEPARLRRRPARRDGRRGAVERAVRLPRARRQRGDAGGACAVLPQRPADRRRVAGGAPAPRRAAAGADHADRQRGAGGALHDRGRGVRRRGRARSIRGPSTWRRWRRCARLPEHRVNHHDTRHAPARRDPARAHAARPPRRSAPRCSRPASASSRCR